MTMNLFIKVDENNVPQDYPAVKENLIQAFPALDFENSVPSGWLIFEKTDNPPVGIYQKFDENIGGENAEKRTGAVGLEYKYIDGKIKEVWHILDLTDEEKTAKQNKVKDDWSKDPNWSSWVFNEQTCEYDPPVERPNDKYTRWSEIKTAWIEYPDDGKNYEWDKSNESWKEIKE